MSLLACKYFFCHFVTASFNVHLKQKMNLGERVGCVLRP